MTRTLLVCFTLLTSSLGLLAQQTIFGTVTDEFGDPVIGGNVAVYKGTDLIAGTQTDFDGNYRINVDPGTYDVEFSYVGYTPRRTTNFNVLVGQENKLDEQFEDDGGIVLETAIVKAYKVDPMKVDETSQGIILTSDDVKQLGTRNINAIASLSAGASAADEGDNISIRGGRDDATQYVIDGIRVTGGAGSLVPETEIDQIQVVTGGVEAKYGDLSGGIISITTKGPSSQFNGYAEAETSKMLDPYNNNLVGVSLSGPILKRATTDGASQTVLGYRFSGRYTYNEDDDPPATDIFYLTPRAREELERNPIVELQRGFLPAAELLTADDVQVLDAQPFEEFERLDLTGKLDARLTDDIDVTLTGSYNDRSDRFTPGETSRTQENWRLLNAHNNPYDLRETIRGNFRFRQRIGNQGSLLDTNNTSLVSNAFYTLQVGWQRNTQLLQDTRHEDRFFDYGYIGSYETSSIPAFDSIGRVNDDGTRTLTISNLERGYSPQLGNFRPGSQNPVLAAYNKLGRDIPDDGDYGDINQFLAFNGRLSNTIDDGVYTLHESIGEIYNRFEREQNDITTVNLQTQFDLKPGRGKAGVHNVQLGVLYEQRVNRRYVLLPRSLWEIANQLGNSAIQSIDSFTLVRDELLVDTLTGDSIITQQFARRFDPANLSRESRFYRAIRDQLGLEETDFVSINELDPDELSLDLFSAAEATSLRNMSFYGYDYLGNETSTGIAWDDFFTSRAADGTRDFPVAPIQPIYAAGYLQDKFTFRNIILRAGVRIDYFDANTKVLKDPYELYDIQTVDNFNFVDGESAPPNVPGSAKVYLESVEGGRVKAFRDGDVWYTAEGRPVNRAAEIFTSTQVPAYVDENANPIVADGDGDIVRGQNYIRSEDFDPDASFEDYEAQINVMPRLAFSFPISDDANFFAHYDVLVQRPPTNTVATALDYYYWFANISRAGFVANNPNLRPTRTVDYEAGFQQRVSAASALKLSFFVREMRDMVQQRTYLFAMGGANQYTTYDNQDFGTVKGLNVAYDLRRTGPISLRLAYALQFADGTGSDADSQSGSLNRGNLRTLYPLSFDERHRLSGSIDYRYGRGEGPEIFGINLFENTGINLFGSAVSGRPYTRRREAVQLSGRANEGDINGARLPWNIVANLRVDRNFSLFADNDRGINLNVYLRVSNLFDRRNIVSVYPATGQPDNDGFLNSPRGVSATAAQLNSEAYIQSYQYRVLNPNFFSLPRRFFLGASVAF